MPHRSAFLIMALLAGGPVFAAESSPIQVPKGASITTDGHSDENEWAGAVRAGNDDIKLSLLESDGSVQIAVRSSPLFVASLCIQQGDKVHIFHASSALGHAIYVREEGGKEWALSQNFEWRLRKKEIGPDAGPARAEHRSLHGWVANTVEMSEPDLAMEFQIDTSYFSGPSTRVALGLLLRGKPPAVDGWPIDPDADACTTQPLIAGPLPEKVTFDTSSWAGLSLQQ